MNKDSIQLKEKPPLNETKKDGSFDWKNCLSKPDFIAAPVSCFKHVALYRCWDNITSGILIEVRSPDCTTCCTNVPCCFWIAAVIKVSGYMGLLRYEGFDTDCSQDFWVNLCTESHIHPIGWCAENGMPLVPPKSIEDKHEWKEYLVRRMSRVRTIPHDFANKLEEGKCNVIKNGMKLEVVDKDLISAVRVATVREVVGGRLHVKYDECDAKDDGFWCHERSSLIHPIGWSQIVGHPLKGKQEYAKQALFKTLYRMFDPIDATWDMFAPVPPIAFKEAKYCEGMKLEAIDPLNLSTICVATIVEVLRNNYLMIGIDGMTDASGSDCFCYHASSMCIFPVGFCSSQGLTLTPPRGYKGEFKWPDYLKKNRARAAPTALFQMETVDRFSSRFQVGMHLEAVDLMEPRLICVATVTKVIGRLLRIHFDGWEDAYDQWCDSESPDLYPVGWCESVGYRLESPRTEVPAEAKKASKQVAPKQKRRRRLRFTQRKRHTEDYANVVIKEEPMDDYPSETPVAMEDSNSS